jgi:hypothetical protein
MKLPTARTNIGNCKVEGGVAAPINYRQIDVGVNIGLNRNTADVVSYISPPALPRLPCSCAAAIPSDALTAFARTERGFDSLGSAKQPCG